MPASLQQLARTSLDLELDSWYVILTSLITLCHPTHASCTFDRWNLDLTALVRMAPPTRPVSVQLLLERRELVLSAIYTSNS